MKRVMTVLAVAVMMLSGAACDMQVIPAAHAQSTVQPGFTPSSQIDLVQPGVYNMGVEALMQDTRIAGLDRYDMPFQLPSNSTIVRWQGVVSWAVGCHGDALTTLIIDGHSYGGIIQKENNGTSAVFFDYSIPMPTGSGSAVLRLSANPVCSGAYAGMSSLEINAMLQVQ